MLAGQCGTVRQVARSGAAIGIPIKTSRTVGAVGSQSLRAVQQCGNKSTPVAASLVQKQTNRTSHSWCALVEPVEAILRKAQSEKSRPVGPVRQGSAARQRVKQCIQQIVSVCVLKGCVDLLRVWLETNSALLYVAFAWPVDPFVDRNESRCACKTGLLRTLPDNEQTSVNKHIPGSNLCENQMHV